MATSQTTTYSKELVVARIRAAIDALPELERVETSNLMSEAVDFVEKIGDFVDVKLPQRLRAVDEAVDIFANLSEEADLDTRFQAAQRVKQAVDDVDSNVPYAPYRDRSKLVAIRTKYATQRAKLEAKLEFIQGADSPSGFTLTALRDFDLIQYLR